MLAGWLCWLYWQPDYAGYDVWLDRLPMQPVCMFKLAVMADWLCCLCLLAGYAGYASWLAMLYMLAGTLHILAMLAV